MPGRTATAEEREHALTLYRTVGPTEAGRQTGFSKASICNWARAAGIATHAPQHLRTATEVSVARRRLTMAEWREEMTQMLRDISMTAAHVEVALLSDKPTLDRATAARVRAISDLMLLTGEATTRIGLSTDMSEQHEQVRRLRDELADRRARKVSEVSEVA